MGLEERCTSIEVEPSVHSWLRNELWSVVLCFSGSTHRQIWRFLAFHVIKSHNFQSGVWWLTEIVRGWFAAH
ncbi:hypothetical protein VNO77_13178 [Canavalia gladiata]|uniref:Uncharacterized protein n=1 Tax=Canavalia gladiata TaxID=3824 RepID=A0AAN9LXM1_CANGL